MERRRERKFIIYGERLQDLKEARSIQKSLGRVAGVETIEILEEMTYVGLEELKFLEDNNPDYWVWAAEGSLRAILEDEDPHSPARLIRRRIDEGAEGLDGIRIALNDLKMVADEGRLEQIQGIGPRRRQFLEHLVREAYRHVPNDDLRDPMPGPY